MPKLLSLVIVSFFGTAAYCQQNNNEGSVLLNTQPNWERLLKIRPKALPPLINSNLLPQNPSTITGDTARLSHRTAQGNVYILPQDNMPCLVPYKQNVAVIPNIPSEQYAPPPSAPSSNDMPNPFAQKPLMLEQPDRPAKK